MPFLAEQIYPGNVKIIGSKQDYTVTGIRISSLFVTPKGFIAKMAKCSISALL